VSWVAQTIEHSSGILGHGVVFLRFQDTLSAYTSREAWYSESYFSFSALVLDILQRSDNGVRIE
jgi:hypothetical protein